MEREEVYALIDQHYRKNYEELSKTLHRHFPNDNEDVVQEAYTRACQYWDTLEQPNLFDRWFNVILSNCKKDQWFDLMMKGQTSEYLPSKDTRSVEGDASANVELKQIDKVIDGKPEHMQRILRLHFWQGYDISDIEKVVPEKYKNIEMIIQRFKKELREDEHMGRGH